MTDEELIALAGKVVDHFASDTRDGNAPGHGHRIPGIWDADNVPELAGQSCEWCADWNAFTALVAERGK